MKTQRPRASFGLSTRHASPDESPAVFKRGVRRWHLRCGSALPVDLSKTGAKQLGFSDDEEAELWQWMMPRTVTGMDMGQAGWPSAH